MTITIKGFDLKDETCKRLKISTDPDPKAIVPALVAAIPDDQLRPVLELVLPEYVLAVNRTLRKSPTPRDNGRQSKQSLIKTLADAIRDRREVFGDDWKYLRHLSMGDVQVIISGYIRRAAANEQEAKRYTRLLNAMQTAKVATAGDLPDELLIEIFQ